MQSNTLTCYGLPPLHAGRTRCCRDMQPGEPMGSDDWKWDQLRSEMWFAVFTTWGGDVKQQEWQAGPSGHPRTCPNTMTGFTGAKLDKLFHSSNITDTEWKMGYNCGASDFHWAPCQSGVPLSPWWQFDGPWATAGWWRSHLKWEMCCIIIFVKISFMNTWKVNHTWMVDILIPKLADLFEADIISHLWWRFGRGSLVIGSSGAFLSIKACQLQTEKYDWGCL